MNKQNRTSNLSFILLLVVILGCLGWLWQADDHAPQVSYAQVRQLFLQEKVKTFDIDTDHTLTLTLREPVDGNSEVRYKLYDFQLFYDDLNDLVQQQYADGIITDYDYPDPETTNWLEVLLPWVLTALLLTAFAGVLLQRYSPAFALLLSLGAAVWLLLRLAQPLRGILQAMVQLGQRTNAQAFSCLLRSAGILLLADYVRTLCEEAGADTLAWCAGLAGRCLVLAAVWPLLEQIFQTIWGLVG